MKPIGELARATLDSFELEMDEARRREFYSSGWWRDATVIDDFESNCRRDPQKTAVVTYYGERDTSDRVTYSEMAAKVERIAGFLLDLGLEPGDVVTAQLPNWWQFNAIALGTLRIGAVFNPIIPVYRKRDVQFITQLLRSKVCFVPETFRNFSHLAMMAELATDIPSLRHIVVVKGDPESGAISLESDVLGRPWEVLHQERLSTLRPDPDQVAEVLFTSGTTGEPKGVGHTHNTEFARARSIFETLNLDGDDVVFMPLTLGHSTGLIYGCLTPSMLGMKAVYQDIWDPDRALDIIEREGVTWSFTTTTFVVDLIRAQRRSPRNLSQLRYLVCGGSAIPPSVVVDAQEVLSARLMAVWGMTENGAVTCTHPAEPALAAAESDGLPCPWMELKVANVAGGADPEVGEVGELRVRGASQMLGYVRRRELTKSTLDDEGWLATGDLVRMDAQGHVRVTGRSKDLIVRGGENVPVVEIEFVLFDHPSVSAVAVVGYPDDRLGERACAFVVPYPGHEVTLASLTKYLEQAGVAKPYWPERLEVVEELPVNATGKVQKFVLRQMLIRDHT